MKDPLQKWVSKALLVSMIATTLGPVAVQASPDQETIQGTNVNLGAEAAAGENVLPANALQADAGLHMTDGEVQGEYSLNLTETGDADWIHLRGDNLGKVAQVKKAGGSSVTFDVYGNTASEGKTSRGSDVNYMSYTWTDGMEGAQYGSKDTGFGVFYPADSREPGQYDRVGWNIQVEPQAVPSTLMFGLGMWQADVKVEVYADELLLDTKQFGADAASKVMKVQLQVPAQKKIRVDVRLTNVRSKNGNMSFSGLALSNRVLADKLTLNNEYNRLMYMTQGLYTDESWANLVNAREEAKRMLDLAAATQQQVDSAYQGMLAAQAALVKRESNIVIDYTGHSIGEYTFGTSKNEQARYQTFSVEEGFTMKVVQFVVKRYKEPVSDLVVQLHAVNAEGLPEGEALAKTVVKQDSIIDGGLTTAELSYDLQSNTRYALVLTQEQLGLGSYRWMVMPKITDSMNEYFGKKKDGVLLSESTLGTGMMRIVKEGNIVKAPLLEKLEQVKQVNRQLFTLESWSALEAAVSHAEQRLSDVDVKQEELDAALLRVQQCYDQLALGKNLEDVAVMLAGMSQAVLAGYTDESAASLKAALQAAQALPANAAEQERILSYSAVLNAMDALQLTESYQYATNPKVTAGFGFEGDKNATLAFLDGSYQIGGNRPMQHGPVAPKQMVTFGATSESNIKWVNGEGYLPVFIHEFDSHEMKVKLESFANKRTVDGKDYVVNYTRMTVTNASSETRLLPVVSSNLVPMNAAAANAYVIKPGETVVREYAIEADKYEYFDAGKEAFASLSRAQIAQQGSFDSNYSEMKSYWNTRLASVVDMNLPNKELVNAFKAGYIYNMIIKDGNYLHVGENGYARLYSHDTIGIFVQLIQSGDFAHAREYLESIPLTGGINIETGQIDPNQFWDANWKLPWTYAVYLSKTGDASIFDEMMTADDGSKGTVFEKRVKFGARSIESDRAGEGGIMKQTKAIDTLGLWTIDNYSALTGLASYEYIARELHQLKGDDRYLAEAEWAKAQYDDLLADFTAKLESTMKEKGLDYIPASVVQSNDENRMKDSRDANWASMFLFGRWLWDGYLYGAEQPADNINLTKLDDTYTYGMERRVAEGTTDSPYNFGGYPHGFYSSAYNAGYGSAALRGEKYRDMGIKAYEFMIEKSMSGPFSWWEGINYPAESSPWTAANDRLGVQNTPGGGGSAQHMWGQAVNSKVLVDSLIAERIYDKNQQVEIIVGRGIPKEWVKEAAKNKQIVASINNYPALQGGRVGYEIKRSGNKLVFTFSTSLAQAKVDAADAVFSIQLPSMVNNIKHTSAGTIDQGKGMVTVPLQTKSVTITLSDLPNDNSGNNGNEGNSGNNGNNGSSGNNGNNGNSNNGNNNNNGNNGSNGNGGNEKPEQQGFSDIAKHWGREAIEKAVERGIVKGYEDSTFRPNAKVTRSELMAMLVRALKLPADETAVSFKDAASIPAWAKPYVSSVVKAGLVKGYEDHTFRPGQTITRMELVSIVARALELKGSQAALPFVDADDIPAWGREAAAAVYEAGLIQGKNQRFAPNDAVTRAEAVTLLLRMAP